MAKGFTKSQIGGAIAGLSVVINIIALWVGEIATITIIKFGDDKMATFGWKGPLHSTHGIHLKHLNYFESRLAIAGM